MWVFPFLHYRHQYPLTTFDQEWWCALLGVLALTSLRSRDCSQRPQIPRIVQLPAALIALVLLQSALGMMAYPGQSLLYILYLLFGLLLMILGHKLRDYFGIDKLSTVLALFLLAGSELSALIGVVQHYRWHSLFDSLMVVKVSSAVYGNLAQPNHFANYIALGLISLGFLFQQRRLKIAYVVLLAIPLLFVLTLSGSRSSWLYLLMMTVLAWRGSKDQITLRPLLRYSLCVLAGFSVMHGIVQLPFMQSTGSNYNIMQRMFADTASGNVRLDLWREAWQMFNHAPWLGFGFGQFSWQHFQMGPELHRTSITGLYNNAHNLVFQLAAEAGVAGLLALFVPLGVWINGVCRIKISAAHWWAYAALGVLAIHSLLEYPLWYAYFLGVAAILLGALDETHYRLRNSGRLTMTVVLLLAFLSLIQLKIGYQQLKDTLALRPASGNAAEVFQHNRDNLAVVHNVPLLSPYADLFLSSYIEVNASQLQEKLALNAGLMRFIPIAPVVYRHAFLLAQDGQLEASKMLLAQAIWSYPDNAAALQQLHKLAEKDPAHFASLLEFGLNTEQEYARAVHNK
jgi:O-antigen ligase